MMHARSLLVAALLVVSTSGTEAAKDQLTADGVGENGWKDVLAQVESLQLKVESHEQTIKSLEDINSKTETETNHRKLAKKAGKGSKKKKTSFCYANAGISGPVNLFNYKKNQGINQAKAKTVPTLNQGPKDKKKTTTKVDYGTLHVDDGETIVVDVTASSQAYMLNAQKKGISENGAELYMVISLKKKGTQKWIEAEPANELPLHVEQDISFNKKTVEHHGTALTTNGKFIFPYLDDGNYVLSFEFLLYSYAKGKAWKRLQAAVVELDSLLIQVDRLDAESTDCDIENHNGIELIRF